MAQQQRFDWWAAVPVRRAAPARTAGAADRAKRTDRADRTDQADRADRVDQTGQVEVYRAVQDSAAFGEIRRSHRRFAFPATAAFLGWYLLYLIAQAVTPGLMRRQVAGPVNVAWLLGLAQFASTFLLAFLYARNARTRRDRAALALRWDTQDSLR